MTDYYVGVIATQSNGVGNGGPDGPQDWAVNQVLGNNATNTSQTDPATFGTGFFPPDIGANPFHNGNNNLTVQYAKHLANSMPGITIKQVIAAKGGQPLRSWMDLDEEGKVSKGDMYARTQNVFAALGVTQPLHEALMIHGQNNDPVSDPSGTLANVDTPREKLLAYPLLHAAFMADGITDANTLFFVAEEPRQFANANAVNRVLAAQTPNHWIVPTENFPTSDGVHFASSVSGDIGQAIMDVRTKALNPPPLASCRIKVRARSSLGQKLYGGTSITHLTGFMPINFDVREQDTHGLFDGSVFHVERDADYDIRGMITAIDQLYPAGTEFAASMFKLTPGGTWSRHTDFPIDPIEGAARRSPQVPINTIEALMKGDKVWIGARMNPPPGTSWPSNVDPRLNPTAFVNWLTIRELDA